MVAKNSQKVNMKRRRQNQKFPSFQIFRFAAGSVGGAANKNDRKFLGFAPRELVERGRGASVIRQNPADFARNIFELRPIHTAKFYIQRNWKMLPQRKAPRHGIFPQFWRHFWNPTKASARQCGSSQSEALAKWNFANQSFFFRLQRKVERIFLWLPKN